MTSRTREIFCNRTLNLRAIRAIGYDMDYTLAHYNFEAWEERAYARLHACLRGDGWPVEDLRFDPHFVIRGLVIDLELGNIVKANRFGYVVRSFHGTSVLPYEQQRAAYRRTPVNLREPRWAFLNTLFSLSEGCLFAQLVDLYDAGRLPGVSDYEELHRTIRETLERAHMEGALKAEIIAHPEAFVTIDPEAGLALLDQREAGKRLMIISNAEWGYLRDIMTFAFDPHLPEGTTWRDLFELVIVAARKPAFFATSLPLFRIINEEGHLLPVAGGFTGPGPYQGGDAGQVERYLGLSGDEILYVGDHVYADVRMSKSLLRWRTALILRELEEEIAALEAFESREAALAALMAEKEVLEARQAALRLELQRLEHGYGPPSSADRGALLGEAARVRAQIEEVDVRVAPLAQGASEIVNPNWGPLLRAGNDKSHLARQLERSADIYTSRVSNFLRATPFAYLRSSRGTLPHDPARVAEVE